MGCPGTDGHLVCFHFPSSHTVWWRTLPGRQGGFCSNMELLGWKPGIFWIKIVTAPPQGINADVPFSSVWHVPMPFLWLKIISQMRGWSDAPLNKAPMTPVALSCDLELVALSSPFQPQAPWAARNSLDTSDGANRGLSFVIWKIRTTGAAWKNNRKEPWELFSPTPEPQTLADIKISSISQLSNCSVPLTHPQWWKHISLSGALLYPWVAWLVRKVFLAKSIGDSQRGGFKICLKIL